MPWTRVPAHSNILYNLFGFFSFSSIYQKKWSALRGKKKPQKPC